MKFKLVEELEEKQIVEGTLEEDSENTLPTKDDLFIDRLNKQLFSDLQ